METQMYLAETKEWPVGFLFVCSFLRGIRKLKLKSYETKFCPVSPP